jgi:hypothetical protein
MEQVFDVGRGKEGKLAVVAMGGANDEDGPVGFGEVPRFGWVLSISNCLHGRFLCFGEILAQTKPARIDRGCGLG